MTKDIFHLRKPVKKLRQFCDVFNSLISKGATCNIQLQDVAEGENLFSYISVSFKTPEGYTFIFNRDLKEQASEDMLLAVHQLHREMENNHLHFRSNGYKTLSIEATDVACESIQVLPAFQMANGKNLLSFKVKLEKKVASVELANLFILANYLLLDNGNCFVSYSAETGLILKVYLCHLTRPSMEFHIPINKSQNLEALRPFFSKLNFSSMSPVCLAVLNYQKNNLYITVFSNGNEQDNRKLEDLFKALN